MLSVTIVVNDQGQMQLQSNLPSRLALLSLLAQASNVVVNDAIAAEQKNSPKVMAAPASALRVLPGLNGMNGHGPAAG